MANLALLRRERIMQKRLHQLGSLRLVRIVAGQAIGGAEGLPLMGLQQSGIFGIVAIGTKCGSVFNKVKIKFALATVAAFVDRVAGIAARVERGVAAAFFGNIRALSVAGEAEIVLFLARGRLQ